jgi:hypothetical protein
MLIKSGWFLGKTCLYSLIEHSIRSIIAVLKNTPVPCLFDSIHSEPTNLLRLSILINLTITPFL